MQKYLRYCPICAKEEKPDPDIPYYVCGYRACYIDDTITDCGRGHETQQLDFLCEDYRVIVRISNDPKFLEAMIQLRKDDIIEFQSRMAQFRNQVELQESENNKPKCPKCGSTNITTGARGANWAFGFIGASKTVNRCGDCGHTWKP